MLINSPTFTKIPTPKVKLADLAERIKILENKITLLQSAKPNPSITEAIRAANFILDDFKKTYEELKA
jgi:hypothetical protein